MRNIFTFLILTLFAFNGYSSTLYSQLCDFNYNWKKYANRAPVGGEVSFKTDGELVQEHLKNVLKVLKSNPIDHLTADQYSKRLELIEVLDGYRLAGLFPQNYYREERIPVFIDEHNTHCAVGFLLRYTGHGEVAKRIAATNNYAWVKEINDPALPGWQKYSGFTMEELKLIQGAYDFYIPNAFHAPNKLEIPQKPAVVEAYFDKNAVGRDLDQDRKHVWCYGEGKGNVLNGRWEQNYRAGIPWIEGFFKNGARTGQWKEYYKGTDILCRTENWRNDKLNGVRTRFDRQGNVIERIVFKDGNAILKTNYELIDSLTYIRKPLDSNLVWTEIYTTGGGMIAAGHERIHNPSNLQWFQNIELTALNSAAITARDASSSYEAQIGAAPGQANQFGMVSFNNTPSLVEYHKEGEWVFYPEFNRHAKPIENTAGLNVFLSQEYRHFGPQLAFKLRGFENLELKGSYDSICVSYDKNRIIDFVGIGEQEYTHFKVSYHEPKQLNAEVLQPIFGGDQWVRPLQYGRRIDWDLQLIDFGPIHEPIKSIGLLNKDNKMIGEWKHYNVHRQLFKTETYLIPSEVVEDELIGSR